MPQQRVCLDELSERGNLHNRGRYRFSFQNKEQLSRRLWRLPLSAHNKTLPHYYQDRKMRVPSLLHHLHITPLEIHQQHCLKWFKKKKKSPRTSLEGTAQNHYPHIPTNDFDKGSLMELSHLQVTKFDNNELADRDGSCWPKLHLNCLNDRRTNQNSIINTGAGLSVVTYQTF